MIYQEKGFLKFLSMNSLRKISYFIFCEFAIRAFLQNITTM